MFKDGQEDFPSKRYNNIYFRDSVFDYYNMYNDNDLTKRKLPASFNRLDKEGIFENGELRVSNMNHNNKCPFEGCCVHSHLAETDTHTKSIKNKKKDVVFDDDKLPEFRKCACHVCNRNDYRYYLDDILDEEQFDTSLKINDHFDFKNDRDKDAIYLPSGFISHSLHNNNNREKNSQLCNTRHPWKKKWIPSSLMNPCKYCINRNRCLSNREGNKNEYKCNSSRNLLSKKNWKCSPDNWHWSEQPEGFLNPSSSGIDSQIHTISYKHSPCEFCLKNGQSTVIFNSHQLKDEFGVITCPILKQRADFDSTDLTDPKQVTKSNHQQTSKFKDLCEFSTFMTPSESNQKRKSYVKTKNSINDYCSNGDFVTYRQQRSPKSNSDCSCSNWFPSHICEYCLSIRQSPLTYNNDDFCNDEDIISTNTNCPILKQHTNAVDYGICSSCGHLVTFPVIPLRRNEKDRHYD